MACGHYTIPQGGEPCAQASTREGSYHTEHVPCDALIYELEISRTKSWGWTCEVDGQVIQVVVSSSGHCDDWQAEGYQKPDYLKLGELAKQTPANDCGTDTSTSNSAAKTDDNLNIDRVQPKKETLWKVVKGLVG